MSVQNKGGQKIQEGKKKEILQKFTFSETGLQSINLCSETSLQTVTKLFTCNFGVRCNNALVLDS